MQFTAGVRMGRKKAADPRDRDHLAIDHVPTLKTGERVMMHELETTKPGQVPDWAADLPRQYRHHKRGRSFPLDQDGWSACVGYAFTELVLEGPIMQGVDRLIAEGGYRDLDDFIRRGWYLKAQEIDEWPGGEPSYSGTSMRAGAQVGQNYGFWPNYYWLTSVEEMARYVILHGPIPIGVDMFTGMFSTDARGYLSLTGKWEGGHAMLVDGVNISEQYVEGPQSWGKDSYTRWKIRFEDMAYLLRQGGDALAIPEIRIPRIKK